MRNGLFFFSIRCVRVSASECVVIVVKWALGWDYSELVWADTVGCYVHIGCSYFYFTLCDLVIVCNRYCLCSLSFPFSLLFPLVFNPVSTTIIRWASAQILPAWNKYTNKWIGLLGLVVFELCAQTKRPRFSFLIIRFFVYKYFRFFSLSLDYLTGIVLIIQDYFNWDTHNSFQLGE